MLENVKYTTSSYIVLVAQNNKTYQLKHLITRKVFGINPKVASIIKGFDTAQTIKESYASCSSNKTISETAYYEKINFLVSHKVLVLSEDDEHLVQPSEHNFFNSPSLDFTNPKREIAFLGVPFGNGNRKDHRCYESPKYIRAYAKSHNCHLTIDKHFEAISSIIDFKKLKAHISHNSIKDWGDLYINIDESKQKTYANIYKSIKQLLQHNKVPFVLGGDHSISFPIIKALGEQYKRFNVIHFDAHLDTYERLDDTLYTSGDMTHNHGNFITSCLKQDSVATIYHVGVRGVVNADMGLKSKKQQVIWADQIMNEEVNFEQIISNDLPVYITFDIDVFDPVYVSGTATPVINGLHYSHVNRILKTLAHLNVIGVDLVEVNPSLDSDKLTVDLALNVIFMLMNLIDDAVLEPVQ